MPLFPFHILPEWPPAFEPDFEEQVTPGPGRSRFVLETLGEDVLAWPLKYACNRDETQELLDFWRSVRGKALSFSFYDVFIWHHDALDCGDGDGAETIFQVPMIELRRDMSTPVVTVGGLGKTEGTDYEIGQENRATYSEDFSQTGTWAAQGGEAVGRTSGQTDPDGGSTAWRLQGDGAGAGTEKIRQVIGTPTTGLAVYGEVWLKVPVAAPHVTVSDAQGQTWEVEDTGVWTQVGLTDAAASGAHHLALSVPAAANLLDCYVWHPWAAWEDDYLGTPSSSWGYVPTYATAATMDSSRRLLLGFYSGSTPVLSAAVLFTGHGRRLYTAAFTAKPQFKWSDLDRFEVELKLREAL